VPLSVHPTARTALTQWLCFLPFLPHRHTTLPKDSLQPLLQGQAGQASQAL
jgi:hypothetical protein